MRKTKWKHSSSADIKFTDLGNSFARKHDLEQGGYGTKIDARLVRATSAEEAIFLQRMVYMWTAKITVEAKSRTNTVDVDEDGYAYMFRKHRSGFYFTWQLAEAYTGLKKRKFHDLVKKYEQLGILKVTRNGPRNKNFYKINFGRLYTYLDRCWKRVLRKIDKAKTDRKVHEIDDDDEYRRKFLTNYPGHIEIDAWDGDDG